MIPTLSLTIPTLPNPAPLAGNLEVSIAPAASGSSQSILAGSSVVGGTVVFSDLNGLAAYTGADGWDTRKPRDVSKYARGIEDTKWRQHR